MALKGAKAAAGKKINRKKGKATLIPIETLRDLADAGDAFLGLTFSPAGIATITINGATAVLQFSFDQIVDVIIVTNGVGRFYTLYGKAGDFVT